MTRRRMLILGLIAALLGAGGAGAMLWHGQASSSSEPGQMPAEAGPAAHFAMPLLLVPLAREGEPVIYVSIAPELHLAAEADRDKAALRLPHLQDRFVLAAYAGGQGGPMKDGVLDLAVLRLRLLAAARASLGEAVLRDLTVTETMRQRR